MWRLEQKRRLFPSACGKQFGYDTTDDLELFRSIFQSFFTMVTRSLRTQDTERYFWKKDTPDCLTPSRMRAQGVVRIQLRACACIFVCMSQMAILVSLVHFMYTVSCTSIVLHCLMQLLLLYLFAISFFETMLSLDSSVCCPTNQILWKAQLQILI